MTELFKIIFPPLLRGFTKYFKPTMWVMMIILIIWLLTTSREDRTNQNDDCQAQLKDALQELKDTRMLLLQYALNTKAQDASIAKNDSTIRTQTQQNIKAIMP